MEPDYLLGNIKDTPMLDLIVLPQQVKFGLDKRDTLTKYCRDCDVRFACNGGCPKDRFIETPDGEPGLHYLCAGYKASSATSPSQCHRCRSFSVQDGPRPSSWMATPDRMPSGPATPRAPAATARSGRSVTGRPSSRRTPVRVAHQRTHKPRLPIVAPSDLLLVVHLGIVAIERGRSNGAPGRELPSIVRHPL